MPGECVAERSDRPILSLVERPGAFWCRIPSRPNFGDALGPWLISRLTGRDPIYREPTSRHPHVVLTGSTIAQAGAASVVWGAGIMNFDDCVDPRADVRATRGPRTAARVRAAGGCAPSAIGDPALLLPRLLDVPPGRTDALGLVAHMSDRPRLTGALDLFDEVELIDAQSSIEVVVREIARHGLIASSSLHGIIVAHAYGVPAAWVEFRPLPSGDRSKFLDYFESIGVYDALPVAVTPAEVTQRNLERFATPPPERGAIDLEALWEVCPLRDGRWTAFVS